MKYLKLFENHNESGYKKMDADYMKIDTTRYNELLYGHYSVFDFDEERADRYMNSDLSEITNMGRIERYIKNKFKSNDRIEFDFHSNYSHYAPGHYKVNIDDYEKKNLIISLIIYNPNREGWMYNDVVAIIHEIEDEYFIVDFHGLNGFKSMESKEYYQCDQVTGLEKFIKDKFKINL